MTLREQPELETLDLIWGVAGIAKAIGRTVRQTETALAKGELPGKKCNGRYVVSRRKLVEHFEGTA